MAKHKKKQKKSRPLFQVHDRVRAKRGTISPNYPDIPLGGWVGEILEIEPGRVPRYTVSWSDETLDAAHPIYHSRCRRDDLLPSEAHLAESCLERDPGGPLSIEQPTNLITRPLSPDEFEDRVRAIFGRTTDEPLPDVDTQTLRTYGDYLASHLSFPFEAYQLDAAPDVAPEVTVLGMKEPSPIREATLDGLPPDLLVRVRREEEEAELPLSELEMDAECANSQLLDDYCGWVYSGSEAAGEYSDDEDWDEDYDEEGDEDFDEGYDQGEDEEYDEEDFLPADADYARTMERLQDVLRESQGSDEPEPEPTSGLPPVPRLTKQETVGRNAPCPCGSGKKYKKCCMNKQSAAASAPPAPVRQAEPAVARRPLAGLSGLPATPDKTAYQLKVSLLRLGPPIWRRFQVRDCTLETLHGILQAVMGWSNDHLYSFTVEDKQYVDPARVEQSMFPEKGADTTTISRLARKGVKSFTYLYDFGDSWTHEIVIEETLPPEHQADYPVCVEGQRACPPEDCGGVWGYARLLEELAKPEDEQDEEATGWIEGDPEAFDPEKVNRRLQWARKS